MKAQPILYLFSGLGADYRVFRNLVLPGYETCVVEWLPPEKSEPLAVYAGRIAAQVKAHRRIFIGVSFGGMVAQEVARVAGAEKIILVSSVKNRLEIPFYFRLAGYLRLHRLLPTRLLLVPSFLNDWIFGARAPHTKALLAEILRDTDPRFLRWAINAVVRWDRLESPPGIIQVHGSTDRIFPHRLLRPHITMENCGHLMVFEQGELLSEQLLKAIGQAPKGVIPLCC